jgi:hypothetical protein
MAIHKITPRSLDKSSSKRLVASTSFVDAINAVTNDSSDGGDGVIKAARGNTNILFHYFDDNIWPGDHKVIGSVVDNKLKLIYFFVKHSNINHNGVWVYDPNGVLSLHTKYAKTLSGDGGVNLSSVLDDQKNTIKCVAKGSYFNFDEHSVIQGNVVYGNSLNVPTAVARAVRGESGATISVTDSEKSTYEKDFHLYFTDNKGEPRKINVIPSMFSRAIASRQGLQNPNGIFTSDEGGSFMLPYTEKEKILFSYACKPTPLNRPSFVFNQDVSSEENNFVNSPGFKFAYQVTFLDGTKSAISPKSELAFIPSVVYQGKNKTPNHSQYNNCRITIEDDYLDPSIFIGDEKAPYVKEISILAQEGDGPYKIVKKISNPSFPLVYNFRNDVIGITVPSSEENKFFDSVPQKAEAQAVVDNRLMYGNYVDGLPKHPVSAQLSVEYKSRPSENYGTPISIESTIALDLETTQQTIDYLIGSYTANKQSGFRITIDDGDFPILSPGDILNFSISFLPNKNFHIYNSIGSFHQSRQLGVKNDDFISQGDQFYQTEEQAGVNNLCPPGGMNSNNAENFLADGTAFAISNPNNDGVASATWSSVDGIYDIESPQQVFFGTSAANPFIIPGRSISFSVSLKCTQAGGPGVLREKFYDILDRVLGGIPSDSQAGNDYFSVEAKERLSKFSWDLGLQNFQRTEEGSSLSKLISAGVRDVYYSEGGETVFTVPLGRKIGACVIPNKGTAAFRLKKVSESERAQDPDFDDSKSREYKIVLDHVPQDIELWTCLRKWQSGSPWWFLDPSWMAGVAAGSSSMDQFYVQSTFDFPDYVTTGTLGGYYAMDIPGPEFEPLYDPVPEEYLGGPGIQQNKKWDFIVPRDIFGGLSAISGTAVPFNESFLDGYDSAHMPWSTRTIIGYASSLDLTNPPTRRFIEGYQSFTDNGAFLQNSDNSQYKYYSVMDGEGGPGGALPPDQLPEGFVHSSYSLLARNPAYNGVNYASSVYGYSNGFSFFGPYFTSRVFSNARYQHRPSQNNPHQYRGIDYEIFNEAGYNDENTRIGARTVLPMLQGKYSGMFNQTTSNGIANAVVFDKTIFYSGYTEGSYGDGASGNGNPKLPFSFGIQQSRIEQFGAASFEALNQYGVNSSTAYEARSFKTRSDHEFGVVFYDKLGRRSFVNSIGSIYVPGYSDIERGSEKGAVSINIDLSDSVPPAWASKYQIVYGGNKTSGDFIQYTTNNAYIENTSIDQEELNLDEGKIYVSLNMLQSSSISYAKEFGARGDDQSLSLYKFSDGDKLRIISYGQENQRTYPKNYLFDVISVEYFDPLSGLDANPLIDSGTPESRFFGEFVVIRNNVNAIGFTYEDILSASSLWNRNVAFEIFSPIKATGVETKVYQEVGGVYNINLANPSVGPSAGYVYGQTNINITEGDVFFRPLAVNLNKFNTNFEDLFYSDSDATDNSDDLRSNFNNLFLESASASNLIPSKIKNFGRFNVESENAKRVRREAGIIYSEKSNPESDILNYSSFNASLFPYKDIEERFGNINFMDEIGGNLFVIQQDRCTMIPVSSTMLSNALGEDQLIASNEILGKERVYSVKAGCDNNPESVVRIDNTFYFAHKSSGKVFRFVDGQGIEEISDVGMSAYFKALFSGAIAQSTRTDAYDVRIVGGYDPIGREYMLTVLSPKDLDTSSNGPDTEIIFGCTDPASINYNPAANADDGSCIYEDDPIGNIVVEGYNGGVISFDNLPYGITYTNNSITIKNVGDAPVSVISYFINNDPADIFNINTPPSSIEPGQSFQFTITAFKNSPWISSGSSAVINFSNNDGYTSFSVPLSASFVEEEEDDVQVIGDYFFNTKYYLGGTEITQTFADNVSPLWKLQVGEDKKLQYVSNTLSGPGKSALVEVEISLNSEAYSQAGLFPFAQGQKLVISGSIDANQVGGLTYQPIQTSANIPANSYSVSIEDNRIFELEIYHNGLPTPSNPTVRISVCNIRHPEESIGQIYDFGDIVLEPNVPTIVGQLGEVSLYGQSYVEYVDYKNSDNREVTVLEQLELIQSEVNGFSICLLDFDGDGIVSYDDVYNIYFNNPSSLFDLDGDGVITIDDYETALQYVGFICPVQPNAGDGGEDEPGDEPGEVDNTRT